MFDSGASVNVCPKWLGESVPEKSDGSIQLGGADGRTLHDYGKRQIWKRIGSHLRQDDFHVVEVAKSILSVSYLCENGIETHLAREPFSKYGEKHEPLLKTSGVYFVKAQIVHESQGYSRVMRTSSKLTKLCVRARDSQMSCARARDHKTHA